MWPNASHSFFHSWYLLKKRIVITRNHAMKIKTMSAMMNAFPWKYCTIPYVQQSSSKPGGIVFRIRLTACDLSRFYWTGGYWYPWGYFGDIIKQLRTKLVTFYHKLCNRTFITHSIIFNLKWDQFPPVIYINIPLWYLINLNGLDACYRRCAVNFMAALKL